MFAKELLGVCSDEALMSLTVGCPPTTAKRVQTIWGFTHLGGNKGISAVVKSGPGHTGGLAGALLCRRGEERGS